MAVGIAAFHRGGTLFRCARRIVRAGGITTVLNMAEVAFGMARVAFTIAGVAFSVAKVVLGLVRRVVSRRLAVAKGVVQRAPVGGLDVLPRPVALEGRPIAKRCGAAAGIGGVRARHLGARKQRETQRRRAEKRVEESRHRWKRLDHRHRSAGHRSCACTGASGLVDEASRGQMLRGGRSWPPERKVAAGARRSGKDMSARSRGPARSGPLPTKGVAEQNAEQTLHESCTPGDWPSSTVPAPLPSGEYAWKAPWWW